MIPNDRLREALAGLRDEMLADVTVLRKRKNGDRQRYFDTAETLQIVAGKIDTLLADPQQPETPTPLRPTCKYGNKLLCFPYNNYQWAHENPDTFDEWGPQVCSKLCESAPLPASDALCHITWQEHIEAIARAKADTLEEAAKHVPLLFNEPQKWECVCGAVGSGYWSDHVRLRAASSGAK